MKTIIKISFLCICFLLSKCSVSTKYTYESTYAEFKELSSKRDSELTTEQLKMKSELMSFVFSTIAVKDNKFVNLSKPKDFEAKVFSRFYYDILEQSIDDFNKSSNFSNLDSIFKEIITTNTYSFDLETDSK